jgi:hypothetical protein
MIRKSYKKACILWIDEVQSYDVSKRFTARLQTLVDHSKVKNEPAPTVKQLYHGTSYVNIKSICDQGWKITLNRRSSFGSGTYFATDALYSVDYMNVNPADISYMLVADVIVGKTGLGGLSSSNNSDPSVVHTFVNSIGNPTIYVCRNDDDAVVRYVIAFHKSAPQ